MIMKNILRKILIIAICALMILLMGIRACAEEETSQTEIIHSNFYNLTVKETRTLEVPFSREWFKAPAGIYNHNLAKLSMGLATAAFRPHSADEEGIATDANLAAFLQEAHFSDLRSDDYDKNPSMYTVSTVMGHQKIGEGDEAFELIAVGVCGQGYVDEWESNFSIGTGSVHEGFDRSAKLVYDRIFGYIASMNLQGPLKIWMSGFSRAAAITNITAARLSDSPVFSQETVYAYTFATPRTVRDENSGRYTNIFNIVGKTDPVPAVPFADWGYYRYGETFYLPAPETDSDYLEKRTRANVVYKELTGIDYWYNIESDQALRTILAYCLELSPTVDIYTASLQDKLIRLWEDRSPVNITMSLLDLANDPVLINEKNQQHANMLLNYMTSFASSWLYEESVFAKWNPTASLGANMLQAHTPELYVSWIYSVNNPAELFTPYNSYTEVYINSSSPVSLLRDGKVIETIDPLYGPDATEDEMIKAGRHAKSPEENVYLRYVSDSIMCTLPRDASYSIYSPAEGGENYFSGFQVDYTTESQNPEKAIWYDYTLDESDGITVTFEPHEDPRITVDKGLVPEKLTYSDDLNFDVSGIVIVTRSESSSLPWRTAAILVLSVFFLVITLILFQLTFIIGKIRFNGRVKRGWLPPGSTYRRLPILCMYAIFMVFMIKEFFGALYPDDIRMVMMFKLAIGMLACTTAAMGYTKNKSRLSGWILVALILLAGADIVTTTHMSIGAGLHIIAYLVLGYAYWQEEKPDRKALIIWGFMTLAAIGIVMTVGGHYGIRRFMAVLYLAAALFMVTASFGLVRRVFSGSLLLFISGLLLMVNVVNGKTFLSHIVSLGTYYLAIAVLASANTRIVIPRLVPEDSLNGFHPGELPE
jgi:hypothetical protein